jgi:hypothetical protein
MASAFARKQLEKYGWKEGEGLGRNKDGMNNYIKTSRHNRTTHNREERGNTYAGIGHESSRGAGAGFTERQNELEAVFDEIAKRKRNPTMMMINKKKRRQKDVNVKMKNPLLIPMIKRRNHQILLRPSRIIVVVTTRKNSTKNLVLLIQIVTMMMMQAKWMFPK